MDFFLYWFMLPISAMVATIAMLGGIGGAGLFISIFFNSIPNSWSGVCDCRSGHERKVVDSSGNVHDYHLCHLGKGRSLTGLGGFITGMMSVGIGEVLMPQLVRSCKVPVQVAAAPFVICGSCHWCASCLKLDTLVTTCPICSDSRLEFMPLTEKEAYTFERDAKRGIVFRFHSRSQKSLGGSS